MDSLIAVGASAAIIYGIFVIFRLSYGLGHGDAELVSRYSMDIYFESAGTILTLITLGKFLEAKSKGKTSEASKNSWISPRKQQLWNETDRNRNSIAQIEGRRHLHRKTRRFDPRRRRRHRGSFRRRRIRHHRRKHPCGKKRRRPSDRRYDQQNGLSQRKSCPGRRKHYPEPDYQSGRGSFLIKSAYRKMDDKIAGVFVPVVMGIAAAAFLIWIISGATFEFALSIGIAILVISCPCALGLATPVAIMVGTGKGAENGILIKSGEALEIAHSIDTVVLDKTGTITEGRPAVTDVIPMAGLSEEELIRIAVVSRLRANIRWLRLS